MRFQSTSCLNQPESGNRDKDSNSLSVSEQRQITDLSVYFRVFELHYFHLQPQP